MSCFHHVKAERVGWGMEGHVSRARVTLVIAAAAQAHWLVCFRVTPAAFPLI